MKLEVQLHGVLGEAIEASRRGRLSHFITGPDSPAIRLFAPAHREVNDEGDWYGEHAGKWLLAAARAAARSGDAVLRERVLQVAQALADQQADDGYLGTYAASHRFMVPQPPKPGTWDGAPARRTWDLWIHAYLVLGLLEVHRQFGMPAALQAAERIADLCARVLQTQSITMMGNHHGLSASVMLDAAAQLHLDTGAARHLQLAETVLAQAEADPSLRLLTRLLDGADPSEIASGKAYQLLWNLVGLAKLARATGRDEWRLRVERQWLMVRDQHLTLGGGPWGGVAHRSREVFNAAGSFSPRAYVETCSTLAWIQLNRELLLATGDAAFAEEIERSAYNDLLGALAPNGEDWCYYVFPNGRRVHTTHWRCCKSSGAMALEELPLAAVTLDRPEAGSDGLPVLSLHVLGPMTLQLVDADGRVFQVSLNTRYPADGEVVLQVSGGEPLGLRLRLRVPAWADGAQWRASWQAGDAAPQPTPAGAFLDLSRTWRNGDRLNLQLPMPLRVHRQRLQNLQVSRAPDGAAVRQEVLRHDHVAFGRGPLVYATGLVDGYKTDETLFLPDAPPEQWITPLVTDPPAGDGPEDAAGVADAAPTLRVAPLHRPPIDFQPYYRAGGRKHGAWRMTWWSLAPDPAAPLTEEPPPA